LAKKDDEQSCTSSKREVLNAEDINKVVNNKQPQSLFRLVTRGTQDRSMLEIAPNYVQINNDD
jgi:hypothetical protein